MFDRFGALARVMWSALRGKSFCWLNAADRARSANALDDASFLKWGRWATAIVEHAWMREADKKGRDFDELVVMHSVVGLARMVLLSGQARLIGTVNGVTYAGKGLGDWRVVIERMGSGTDVADEIRNPARWFFAFCPEAEWWSQGGKSREETIALAKREASDDNSVAFIAEAKRMVPNFGIFDAEELMERLSESECWSEDGWKGMPEFDRGSPEYAALEGELSEVLRRWVLKHGDPLDGALLDFTYEPECIELARKGGEAA